VDVSKSTSTPPSAISRYHWPEALLQYRKETGKCASAEVPA
jgi:hypothetical protein